MTTQQVEQYRNLLEEAACNLCGGNDYDVVYPAKYNMAKPEEISQAFRSSGDEILIDQLVRCRRCGLQYLTPRLKQDIIIDGYSGGSDEAFISQATAREATFARCLELVERYIHERGRILDVGTAGGSFLYVAKKKGWQVSGCEPNRWLTQWAKRHYGLDICPGTIFDMQLEDGSFDVITLWDVLEHTTEPDKVLLECHRLLKPSGLLIVNYPDIGSSVARMMGRQWVFLLSVHLYYFTLPTIRKILEKTGFEMFKSCKHWQSLELDYILFRMKPYVSFLSDWGRSIVKALNIERAQIPYWVGQTLVLARKNRSGDSS